MDIIDARKISAGAITATCGDAEGQETKMNSAWAIYAASFTMATVSVDGRGSVLLFDEADADCLKLAVEKLKSEPDDVRVEFYRMLLDHGPLRGPDGILAQLPEAVVSSEILTIDLTVEQKDHIKSLMA